MGLQAMLKEQMNVLGQVEVDNYKAEVQTAYTTDIASYVRCQRQPMSSARKLELDIPAAREAYRLYYDKGTTLDVGYRVVIDSVTYEILQLATSVQRGWPSMCDIIKVA